MGKAIRPVRVKLIVPMFTADQSLIEGIESRLEEEFGPIDFRSQVLSFDHTSYYAAEFGQPLLRKFVSFARLIDPGNLAEIKTRTNSLEADLAQNGHRLINLDPGYVSLGKVVLASTKNHRHRVYLDRGIYAEVTLFYQNGGYRAWEWTYPDYRTPAYAQILSEIRRIYVVQLREAQGSPAK